MTFFLKDPGAVLDYLIDWGAEYLDGDMLAASEWFVVPDEGGGVTVAGSDFDATTSTVKAAGGASGNAFRSLRFVRSARSKRSMRTATRRRCRRPLTCWTSTHPATAGCACFN